MMKKNIKWLLDGNPSSFQQVWNSNLASIRMRAGLTIQMQSKNINVGIVKNYDIDTDTHLLGIGKLSLHQQDPYKIDNYLKVIKKHKTNGGKVFLDYTDHHLRESNKSSDLFIAYSYLLNESDYVITSSQFLKAEIEKIKHIDAKVIEEPIEFKLIKPKLKKNNIPLTGFWFGHASNLEYLYNFLIHRFKPNFNVKIIIMTNIYPLPNDVMEHLEKYKSKNINLIVLQWSLKDMVFAASLSDFCIIPCNVEDARKAGVSSNRLITALSLGLPCFSDSPSSYKEFKEYYSELSTSEIENFISGQENYLIKTKLSQSMIGERFTKIKINRIWQDFFQSADSSSKRNTLE
jgi:hypothetical protein